MSHACHRSWKCYKTLTFCSFLTRCAIPCACHAKRHPNVQQWSEPLVFLTLWLRNVLRVVHFFDIATSTSAPKLMCFVHFDFEMCFAPQRRALFWHPNFQKCSEPVSFLQFWLGNVLRATTACNFSSFSWPAGSASAALASLLFSTLRTHKSLEKQECFVTFLPFRAPGSSFFWDFLFFDLLSFSLLFADSSHLCFSSVYIVGSLTSKLPSIRENILAKVERLSFWNGHGHFSVKRKTRRYHIYFRMVAFRNGFGPYLCPFPKTSQHSFCV